MSDLVSDSTAEPAAPPAASPEQHAPGVARRLRLAGGLIAAGLAVELFTLWWSSPTSFLLFAGLGGLLLAIGIVVYLLTIAS